MIQAVEVGIASEDFAVGRLDKVGVALERERQARAPVFEERSEPRPSGDQGVTVTDVWPMPSGPVACLTVTVMIFVPAVE